MRRCRSTSARSSAAGGSCSRWRTARSKSGDPPITLADHCELWLERGEHVSLVGRNGAGKTTLIETLAGLRPLAAGKLSRGHNVQIGYLSQHAEELGSDGTVVQAAQRATGMTPGKARALLGRFLFSGEDADKPLSGLSGGERRRLSLAILVSGGANVLILDEPTNHLDIESREALEDALLAFEGALLLVTHDRALLDAVGTRTVALEDHTLHSYGGGWAEYVRVRAERQSGERPPQERRPADQARGRAPSQSRSARAEAARRSTESKNRLRQQEQATTRGRGGRGRPREARGRAGEPGGLGDVVRGGEERGPPYGCAPRGRGGVRAAGGAALDFVW